VGRALERTSAVIGEASFAGGAVIEVVIVHGAALLV
jgi:hypothetical protein